MRDDWIEEGFRVVTVTLPESEESFEAYQKEDSFRAAADDACSVRKGTRIRVGGEDRKVSHKWTGPGPEGSKGGARFEAKRIDG